MGAVGTHTLIGKIVVTASGASSVTFSNIPSTYTDLKIVASTRTNNSYYQDSINITFNGSITNYTEKIVLGDSGSVYSSQVTSGGTKLYENYTSGNTTTTNTFGSLEIYIPNYTSSNYKSISTDSVSENNSTSWSGGLEAGLWSSVAAITSISFTPFGGTKFNQFSTFYLYGIKTSSTVPSPTPKAIGGDIVVNDGTYWYHAFISSGNFIPNGVLTCDVLSVAGGGGGGGAASWSGGGGGAGGVILNSSKIFSQGNTYVATVGAGGAGGYGDSNANTRGFNGVNSNVTGGIVSLTAAVGGGGGGGNYDGNATYAAGQTGGSGGGSNYRGTNIAGGSGTSGQGNAGGTGVGTGNFTAGGGGGAGAVGANSGGSNGAAGGAGTNSYSSWLTPTNLGVSGYIAGGGGGSGGNNLSSSLGGAGGTGGGGNGSDGTYAPGANNTAGTANTGGGGGGRANSTTVAMIASSGGSGLIIIRYPI